MLDSLSYFFFFILFYMFDLYFISFFILFHVRLLEGIFFLYIFLPAYVLDSCLVGLPFLSLHSLLYACGSEFPGVFFFFFVSLPVLGFRSLPLLVFRVIIIFLFYSSGNIFGSGLRSLYFSFMLFKCFSFVYFCLHLFFALFPDILVFLLYFRGVFGSC